MRTAVRELIRFAVNTGLRKDELLGLAGDEVDLVGGNALGRASHTKGMRGRVIQLDRDCFADFAAHGHAWI